MPLAQLYVQGSKTRPAGAPALHATTARTFEMGIAGRREARRTSKLTCVKSRFKGADPDNDGALDEEELRSRTGQLLLRLLQ